MAKDLFHDIVKKALINEGWTVTHDPYPLKIGSVRMFIDLGAERIIAAEKDNEKIAVEIKSFSDDSLISMFHKAELVNTTILRLLWKTKNLIEFFF